MIDEKIQGTIVARTKGVKIIKEEKDMRTKKHKLTAILLVLAMLFTLIPALPQSAEAAYDSTTKSNDVIEVKYTANGVITHDVNVIVQDENGAPLTSNPLVLNDIVAGTPYTVEIKLLDSNKLIKNIEASSGSATSVLYDDVVSF